MTPAERGEQLAAERPPLTDEQIEAAARALLAAHTREESAA